MPDLSFGRRRPFRGRLRTRADGCLVRRTVPLATGFPPDQAVFGDRWVCAAHGLERREHPLEGLRVRAEAFVRFGRELVGHDVLYAGFRSVEDGLGSVLG